MVESTLIETNLQITLRSQLETALTPLRVGYLCEALMICDIKTRRLTHLHLVQKRAARAVAATTAAVMVEALSSEEPEPEPPLPPLPPEPPLAPEPLLASTAALKALVTGATALISPYPLFVIEAALPITA